MKILKKNNFIAIGLTVFLIMWLLAACKNRSQKSIIEFKFLQTSDVHGAIYPYDFIRDTTVNYSLAQVHTYVKKLRNTDAFEVILLDNGDILQGQPTVYFSNYENTGSNHICSDVMNYMKYDAAAVGNHDIEAGHDVYDALVDEFKFPWLAANAVDTEENKPYFEPYMILERKGIKIAILGLITPGIPKWLPNKLWDGMEFRDMVETADYWVHLIREQEDPDILIGLFHSGHNARYGGMTESTYMNENASVLVAERVPGFDIIFIGHDHDTYNAFVKDPAGNDVLVLDPGSRARFISEATIRLEWDPKNQAYSKTVTGRLVETSEQVPDPEFMSEFAGAFEQIKEYVSQPVGHLNAPISSSDALFGDDPFMDLIHTVQLETSGAQISFAAPLSFNVQIDSGILYVRDFFQLYRFENFLYTMSLSGKEIHDYLEYSYDLWMNHMRSTDDNLLRFELDEAGNLRRFVTGPEYRLKNSYYNFDSAEGIIYTVDVSKPMGQRISIHGLQSGTAFNYSENYTVAINSYRGQGGGGHLVTGAGIGASELAERVLTSTDHDLRYHMMHWMESFESFHPRASDNWHVVPQEWTEKAAKKDYEILFNPSQ